MGWRYRKRITISPGFRLNLSKSGISTSVGVRGANLTLGKSGIYLNAGIPGTGIYNRQKLTNSNPKSNVDVPLNFKPVNPEISDNIFSADIEDITSQDMKSVKGSILAAHARRNDLKKDLGQIKKELSNSKIKLTFSYILLYGLIKKSLSQKIKTDIKSQKEAIIQVQEQIEICYVELEIDFDDEIKSKYDQIVLTFKKLITSQKIWDVTSEHYQDTKATRSSARSLLQKKEIKFGFKSLPDIKTKYDALWFNNANGVDLYFYPNFIVMFSSTTKFAIIGIDEIELSQPYSRFIETGSIPTDTKIIDKTWFKVNKNGSPDKRFKQNYQIPVVKYGEIELKTKTGLHE